MAADTNARLDALEKMLVILTDNLSILGFHLMGNDWIYREGSAELRRRQAEFKKTSAESEQQ